MFFCGAFTKPVRMEIKERANWISELSGENDRPLVCAHFRHKGGRKKGRFDYAENGLYVTDIEHLAHHKLFERQTEKIGLSTDQNDFAIYSLIQDIRAYNEINKIAENTIQDEYECAIKNWINLLEKNPQILGLRRLKNTEVVTTLVEDINRQDTNREIPLFQENKFI